MTESINFSAGPYSRSSHSLQVSPVIPFQLGEKWLLIPRIVTTPIAYVADATQREGAHVGMGDTISTFFLTPAATRKLIWAVGLSLVVPTSTNSSIGAGRWDLGPAVAIIVQPDWGSAGFVATNVSSLPGNVARNQVHALQVETSLSLNLPSSWYVFSSPTISADWTQTGRNRWLIPFGGGIGRTMSIANQPVDLNVALYSNAFRPYEHISPKWQVAFQCTLLFQRKRRTGSD